MPCKAPASREPVLPECDTVLAVAGLSALGRPLREVCPAGRSLCTAAHCTGRPLTPELLAALLASEAGGRKLVRTQFYAVLNQADDHWRAPGEDPTILWNDIMYKAF